MLQVLLHTSSEEEAAATWAWSDQSNSTACLSNIRDHCYINKNYFTITVNKLKKIPWIAVRGQASCISLQWINRSNHAPGLGIPTSMGLCGSKVSSKTRFEDLMGIISMHWGSEVSHAAWLWRLAGQKQRFKKQFHLVVLCPAAQEGHFVLW